MCGPRPRFSRFCGALTSELAWATVVSYKVAKGGIEMLTRAMAPNGRKGTKSNATGPGYMISDVSEAQLSRPDFDACPKGCTPMPRWGRPEKPVGTAARLASDASSFASGQIIHADGGTNSEK